MPPDLDIMELENRRAALKARQYRISSQDDEEELHALSTEIRNKRAKCRREIQEEYCQYYFYNRLTWEFERKARGVEEEEYAELAIDLQIPERAQLAMILCHQPDGANEAELDELRGLGCRTDGRPLRQARDGEAAQTCAAKAGS